MKTVEEVEKELLESFKKEKTVEEVEKELLNLQLHSKSENGRKKETKSVKKEFVFDDRYRKRSDDVKKDPFHQEMDNLNLFSSQVQKFYKNDLLPTKIELEKKKNLYEKINRLLTQNFSESQVFMFGSSANNLSIRGNADLDICFVCKKDFIIKKEKLSEKDRDLKYLHQIGMILTKSKN